MVNYNKRTDKNLSKLLAAAGEFAFEWSNNEKEAYQLARLAMMEILRESSQPTDLDEESDLLAIGSPQFH